MASSSIWKSSRSYKASKMLNKKGGWFSKPGMASNDKVTKGHFPRGQPQGWEGGAGAAACQEQVVKVCIAMITQNSSP